MDVFNLVLNIVGIIAAAFVIAVVPLVGVPLMLLNGVLAYRNSKLIQEKLEK